MICSALLIAASIHTMSGFNNFNPGVGVGCHDAEIFADVIVYKNSISKVSIATHISYQFPLSENLSFGPFVGMATGYVLPVTPQLGALLRYRNVNVIFIPPVTVGKKHSPGVVNFSYLF